MITKLALTRRLDELERVMATQTAECMLEGWNTRAGLFWDKRCVERATIRWALKLKHKAFNAADTMAGW